MKIQKILSEKFAMIFTKHNNPIWAREELAYLVYHKYGWVLKHLDEKDLRDIDEYFGALMKIHG